MQEEELGHRPTAFPPGLEMEVPYGRGLIGFPPPPGLARPWPLRPQSASPVPEASANHAPFLTTTPPLPGSKIRGDPQYLSLEWAHGRCDSPLHALGLGRDDARSPDVRPLCPQPRRAFVPFSEPSLPSSPPPWGSYLYSELPEPPIPFGLFEKKELADASRPSSSVSTSAGPTPSPDEFRHTAMGFQSPPLFTFEESRPSEPLRDWDEGRRRRHSEGLVPLEAVHEELTSSRVVEMSKTQDGSKQLQKKLLKGHPSVIQDILEGLETKLPDIMRNPYGNYLCSAAFQSCSVVQRLRMLEIACQHLLAIAKDKWGTHALQSLLSLVCTNDEQKLLLPALKEHLVELSCDQHGTHVVQRALMSFGLDCPDILLHELAGSLRKVAYNPHGLCVLKRCISQSRSGTGQRHLIEEMSRQALDLVQSPYGNYVVQHCFQELGLEMCSPILQALKGRALQLSLQKFSSNVVEQVLRLSPKGSNSDVAMELAEREQSHVLMSTVCGMHVARELLKVVDDADRVALEGSYTATLRGNRNHRLRERWESILAGAHSDEPLAATPPRFDGSHTQLNRSRWAHRDKATPMKQRGSPDKGGKGVLTPGLLVVQDTGS